MNTLKAMALIIAFLIAGELGFQARAYIKRSHLPELSGEVKVLLIGDSVVGGPGESGSVFDTLEKKFKARYGQTVSLIDGTSKANFSAQANYQANELIKKYRPQISIVLLGGSDYINSSAKTESKIRNSINYIKNVFYKTYIYKFIISLSQQRPPFSEQDLKRFDVIRHDSKSQQTLDKQNALYQASLKGKISCVDMSKLAELTAIFYPERSAEFIKKAQECYPLMKPAEKPYEASFYLAKAYRELGDLEHSIMYFEKSLQDNPWPESVYPIIFWISYTKKDCESMLKYFELSLQKTEPNRRMIWQLRNCFALEKREKEGVEFFKKLSNRIETNKNLSLVMSQSLTNGNSDEFLKSVNPEGKDYYLSLLLYYKTNNRIQDANALYLEKDLYIGPEENVIDLKNYRELIGKLAQDNGRVLVLQYPNMPDWTVLEAIAPFKENVRFMGLSGVFKKHLKDHSILDLLSEDFIHVSAIGADVIAEELVEKINQMKKE